MEQAEQLEHLAAKLRARIARRRELGYRLTEISCDDLSWLLEAIAPNVRPVPAAGRASQ